MGPTAVLAYSEQQATVATGSTEGFPTDSDPYNYLSGETIPGATGWWAFGGLTGTTLTIDTCGSSFTAQISLHNIDPRYRRLRQGPSGAHPSFSADGCANPLTATFHENFADTGPDLLRIDDASGQGGEYQVNYRRTQDPPPLMVRAFKAVVGDVQSSGSARRVGRAEVTIPYRTQDDGFYPQPAECLLDKQRGKYCAPGRGSVTFKNVRSGKHRFVITYTAWYGSERSVTRGFRVPYLKPKRK